MKCKFFVTAAAGAAICENRFLEEDGTELQGWSPALLLFKISPDDTKEYSLEELSSSATVERDVVICDALYESQIEAFESIAFHIYDNHSVVVPEVIIFNMDLEVLQTIPFEELMDQLEEDAILDQDDSDTGTDRVLH